MSSKVVTLPKQTIDVILESATETKPAITEQRNAFLQLLGRVAEMKKHKNDTDAYLAHAIDEKIKDFPKTATIIELEEAEIVFIEEGIKQLRSENIIAGSVWYYLIAPLSGAIDKKEYEKRTEDTVHA